MKDKRKGKRKQPEITWGTKWSKQADGSKVRFGVTVEEIEELRTDASVTLRYSIYTEARYPQP